MSDRTETWGFFILTPRIFRKLECVTWEDRDCEWVDIFQSLDVHSVTVLSCTEKGSSELEIKNNPGAGKMVVDKVLAVQVVRAWSCILSVQVKAECGSLGLQFHCVPCGQGEQKELVG